MCNQKTRVALILSLLFLVFAHKICIFLSEQRKEKDPENELVLSHDKTIQRKQVIAWKLWSRIIASNATTQSHFWYFYFFCSYFRFHSFFIPLLRLRFHLDHYEIHTPELTHGPKNCPQSMSYNRFRSFVLKKRIFQLF